MKTYKVRFRPEARRDVLAIYIYIAENASVGIARAYVERIAEACLSLSTFPHRGAVRGEMADGLRTLRSIGTSPFCIT
ncbi:MAG: type II toxin-antitoxin system RelE/ParE family toxin [Caulobacteraceae bacterium]